MSDPDHCLVAGPEAWDMAYHGRPGDPFRADYLPGAETGESGR